MAEKSEETPSLVLLEGKKLTFEKAMDLFRRITGREPILEEIERARLAGKEPEK